MLPELPLHVLQKSNISQVDTDSSDYDEPDDEHRIDRILDFVRNAIGVYGMQIQWSSGAITWEYADAFEGTYNGSIYETAVDKGRTVFRVGAVQDYLNEKPLSINGANCKDGETITSLKLQTQLKCLADGVSIRWLPPHIGQYVKTLNGTTCRIVFLDDIGYSVVALTQIPKRAKVARIPLVPDIPEHEHEQWGRTPVVSGKRSFLPTAPTEEEWGQLINSAGPDQRPNCKLHNVASTEKGHHMSVTTIATVCAGEHLLLGYMKKDGLNLKIGAIKPKTVRKGIALDQKRDKKSGRFAK